MCIAPLTLPDGQQVACHECWQCLEHRVLDWQGRCIAEGATAAAAFAVTLTYGRNSMNEKLHERAVVLTYSDFQKYLKLLRRHGYVVRYFVAGEYGSAKGRAHWHPILYFYPREDGKQPYPPICGVHQHGHWIDDALSRDGERVRFNHQRVDDNGRPVVLQDGSPAWWWPHGFSHWEPVHENSVRYACAYVLKNVRDAEAQGHLAMSKKPPLGARYFERMAERYVEAGLAPQTLEYRMDEARNSRGEPLRFMLKGRSAELYLEHYVRAWKRARPGQPIPSSELVDLWTEYGVVSAPDATEHPALFLEWDRRQRDKVRLSPGVVPEKIGRLPALGASRAARREDREAQERWIEGTGRVARAITEVERELMERGKRQEQQQQNRERERSITTGVGYDPRLRDGWIGRRRPSGRGDGDGKKRHDEFAKRWRKAR